MKPPNDQIANSFVTRDEHSTMLGALGQDTSREQSVHYQSQGQVAASSISHNSADLADLAPPQMVHRPHRPWI